MGRESPGYPRSAGGRAFEKLLIMFEGYGFRPQVVA
jgi:hypothetical protein